MLTFLASDLLSSAAAPHATATGRAIINGQLKYLTEAFLPGNKRRKNRGGFFTFNFFCPAINVKQELVII